MLLRPYQEELVTEVTQAFDSYRRVLIQLPTGGGKTVVFSRIVQQCHAAGGTALVLAHREELITQAASKLRSMIDTPVGIVKAGHKPEYDAPIQVASVQSIGGRLHELRPPDLIVVDECHRSCSKSYIKAMEAFQDAFCLGVTATPTRLDGKGLDDIYQYLITGPRVGELIEDGYLCPYDLYADPDPMVTKGVRRQGGDFSVKGLADANDATELAGNLVQSYERHALGTCCCVFAINVEHSRHIVTRYQAAGIPAAHLDGKSGASDRKETLQKFAAGDIKVLSNCMLFTEGFDMPAMGAVQIARPTASLGLWLQMVGRVLRTSDDKNKAIIIDHTDNWSKHGLPTSEREWTLKGVTKKKASFNKEPDGRIVEVEPEPIQIVETDKKLVKIDADAMALEMWHRKYRNLKALQHVRGYKKGWLVHKLLDFKAPMEIWRLCAKEMGYKPGWAWHQWRKCC